ncbi:hypothetical protein [Spirillospora sp. CA-294931]|uniref:hypothetical protein n=1 Tax=Spirillospora sp. CA-294931 TaxID=3240042 RepID=UPI003D8E3F5D
MFTLTSRPLVRRGASAAFVALLATLLLACAWTVGVGPAEGGAAARAGAVSGSTPSPDGLVRTAPAGTPQTITLRATAGTRAEKGSGSGTAKIVMIVVGVLVGVGIGLGIVYRAKRKHGPGSGL